MPISKEFQVGALLGWKRERKPDRKREVWKRPKRTIQGSGRYCALRKSSSGRWSLVMTRIEKAEGFVRLSWFGVESWHDGPLLPLLGHSFLSFPVRLPNWSGSGLCQLQLVTSAFSIPCNMLSDMHQIGNFNTSILCPIESACSELEFIFFGFKVIHN